MDKIDRERYIRFDWVVKKLLQQKDHIDVLEGFLTVLLGESIKILELLEDKSNQKIFDDRYNRINMKARNSKGEIIIVEVQNTRELYYLERIVYSVPKTMDDSYIEDSHYEVKKIYSVNILYFDIGKGNDYLYQGQNILTGVHTGDHLELSSQQKDALISRLPQEIAFEYFLIRIDKFNKEAVTPLEEWIEYIKNTTIRPDTTTPGLVEAREKLVYYNMTPQERYAYDEHIMAMMIQNDVIDGAKLEGRIEGYKESLQERRQEGLRRGFEQGRRESRFEVARNMKKLNFTSEIIMQVTELSREEIDKL